MLITSPSCAVSGTAGTSDCLTSACCALVNAAAAISTAVYVVGYALVPVSHLQAHRSILPSLRGCNQVR
jgi:hypothetical protein